MRNLDILLRNRNLSIRRRNQNPSTHQRRSQNIHQNLLILLKKTHISGIKGIHQLSLSHRTMNLLILQSHLIKNQLTQNLHQNQSTLHSRNHIVHLQNLHTRNQLTLNLSQSLSTRRPRILLNQCSMNMNKNTLGKHIISLK